VVNIARALSETLPLDEGTRGAGQLLNLQVTQDEYQRDHIRMDMHDPEYVNVSHIQ
jgi:hypothetical protein